MTMATLAPRALLPVLLTLLAAAVPPVCAQQVALGRLFATPAERSALDSQREAGGAPAIQGAVASAPQPIAEAGPPSLTVAAAAPPPASTANPAPPTLVPPAADIPFAFTMPGLNGPGTTPVAPGASAAPPPAAPGVAPAAAPPPAASSAIQLSGVLRGSSGRTTVWLNQVPQTGGVKAGPGPAVSLRLSSGRQLIMKPGQSFDPAHGSVQEAGH